MIIFLLGLLLGLFFGYIGMVVAHRPYNSLEKRIESMENRSPNVSSYSDMYTKLEMLIDYLGVEVKEIKPHYEKKKGGTIQSK